MITLIFRERRVYGINVNIHQAFTHTVSLRMRRMKLRNLAPAIYGNVIYSPYGEVIEAAIKR